VSTYVLGVPSLDKIVTDLAATNGQVERALKRAISSTTRWAADVGRSGIARAMHIRIAALHGRARVYLRLAEFSGVGWFGINDLNSSRLNPVQTPTGAKMEGQPEVPHAFVITPSRGARAPMMFIRTTSLRYPIEPVKLPIHDVANAVLFGDVATKVDAKLAENFDRELRREIEK
jgi:hypothetical protein